MSGKIPLETVHPRNYESVPWVYLLWGAPLVLAVATSAAYSEYAISLTVAGSLWTASVGWMGVGCILNARSCGRVHCMIDGIAFPLMAVAGVLNVINVVSFDWNIFWGVFLAILIASFVPEFLWARYSPKATLGTHLTV